MIFLKLSSCMFRLPRPRLDPEQPVSIGAMVGPEAFTEVRYLAHAHHLQALGVIDRVAKEYEEIIGRKSGGLVDLYRAEDAEVMVVALGSVIGTIKDVIDEMREDGKKVGLLGIKSYRPFPAAEVFAALEGAKTAVVIDRSLQVGIGGVVTDDVIRSTRKLSDLDICCVISGLGGRAITKLSLHKAFDAALKGELPELTFLDLDKKVVQDQLKHEQEERHSGPMAEAIVKAVADLHKGDL